MKRSRKVTGWKFDNSLTTLRRFGLVSGTAKQPCPGRCSDIARGGGRPRDIRMRAGRRPARRTRYLSMKKWFLTGLALAFVALVIGVASAFLPSPRARSTSSQNKVVPVPLSITPAAQHLQATLDVADMHADSLLWQRDLLTRSDRGHVDLPRLIEGHYALQVFSSVTKSPQGQNYNSNGADTDTITSLVVSPAAARTWRRCCNVRCGTRRNCAVLPRTQAAVCG